MAISGRAGILQRALKRAEFADEQRTCTGDRSELRNAVRARLGPMRGAERVHDEYIAERGHLAREKLAVLLLAWIETHVLAQHCAACRAVDAREPVPAQRHRLAEKIRQARRDRRERELLIVDALRSVARGATG